MTKNELPDFTPLEKRFFKGSFEPAVTQGRQRQILVFAIPALASPWAIGYVTHSWTWVAGLTTLYMVVTMLEKLAYGNGVLAYKSVIRKLAARLKEVEAAAPNSPHERAQPESDSQR